VETSTADTPEEVFRRRLQEAREARGGMSQRDLAARLADIGYRLSQSAITRIERGERKVSLGEAIALAAALDVAPVHMFLPIEGDQPVRLAPALEVKPDQARAWATGRRPLDPANVRFYSYQQPHIADLEREEGLGERFMARLRDLYPDASPESFVNAPRLMREAFERSVAEAEQQATREEE
jgi:transcriptional regulator with XRE-family HTH domain